MRSACAQWRTHHEASALRMWTAGRSGGVSRVFHNAVASSILEGWRCGWPCGVGVDRCGRGWGVLGDLRWWRHCWDGSGGPVVFVGGEGGYGGGDDVLSLSLQDDVALRAEVLW